MGSTLTVEIFVSVDGWAGSDGLPAYFGYGGPELEEWIATETAAPHRILMGRKTYELLAGLPEEAQDDGYRLMTAADKVVFSTLCGRRPGPTPGSAATTRRRGPQAEGRRQRRRAAHRGKSVRSPTADECRAGGSTAADDLPPDRR